MTHGRTVPQNISSLTDCPVTTPEESRSTQWKIIIFSYFRPRRGTRKVTRWTATQNSCQTICTAILFSKSKIIDTKVTGSCASGINENHLMKERSCIAAYQKHFSVATTRTYLSSEITARTNTLTNYATSMHTTSDVDSIEGVSEKGVLSPRWCHSYWQKSGNRTS